MDDNLVAALEKHWRLAEHAHTAGRAAEDHVANLSSQVGTGGREEKIRTYNYKDDRVTDHRLKNNFALNRVIEGHLGDIFDACISYDQSAQLESLSTESTAA